MNSVLYTYDKAMQVLLYQRFASILGISSQPTQEDSINQGVVICPQHIAQREVAEKRGEVFLEFINLYRTSVAYSWKRQNTLIARRGFVFQRPDGTVGVVKVDATDITYSMWFWSNDLDKINLCVEKYLQWQHETPKVTLYFNDEFGMNPDIQFEGAIDESNIEDVFNDGKIWTFEMKVRIDGWLPKLSPAEETKLIQKICITTYDRDAVSNYETIVVPGSGQNVALEAALRMFRANLYGIVGVSSIGKTFRVSKNRTSEFPADTKFQVENSTQNDGLYTVEISTYDSPNEETVITVKETITGNTIDGDIYRPEPGAS